jgi:hypothetical protein
VLDSHPHHAGAARSWLLLVGFVPLLGLPLYLLFGHPWLSRERIRRQAEASQVIREEQALQHRLRWTPQPDTASAEIVPLVQRQGDFMPVHGNAVDLLTDYDESLHTLIADIDQAEDRVHLLYYLMFDDAVGEAIVEACSVPPRVACSAACCSMRWAPSAACAPIASACRRATSKCARCCPVACAGVAAGAWTCATTARSR